MKEKLKNIFFKFWYWYVSAIDKNAENIFMNYGYSKDNQNGIGLNKKAIKFCNKKYSSENIKFFRADAQKLNFEDNAFDVVINIEPPHRYSKVDLFLSEVYRVLKPGGVLLFLLFLLFADFGNQYDLRKLNRQFKNMCFKRLNNRVITKNVVEALKLSTPNREELVRKLLPKFLQNLGRNFAATEGTITYNKFLTSEFEYVFYVLLK